MSVKMLSTIVNKNQYTFKQNEKIYIKHLIPKHIRMHLTGGWNWLEQLEYRPQVMVAVMVLYKLKLDFQIQLF